MLKPSTVSTDGVEVTIIDAEERKFLVYGSTDVYESLVVLKLAEFDDWFRLSADNFVAIAKHLNSWNFSSWVGSKIRIYQESKTIRGNTVLMVRVGEKIKRKSKKSGSK